MARTNTSISLTEEDFANHVVTLDYTYWSGTHVMLKSNGGSALDVFEDGEFVGRLHFSELSQLVKGN